MPHVDLLELPYFEGITIDDMVTLVDMMAPGQYEAGEIIVREDEMPPPPLYISTRGNLEITKRGPDGEERPLAELVSPTLFGEIELFCQIPAVATARAIERVSLFSLTRSDFDRLFDASHPAATRFAFNVARVICHRLAIADEMLARVLGGEDLVKLRQVVFANLATRDGWSRTTGAFKRPKMSKQ